MEKMQNVLGKITMVIGIMFFLWIIVSWIDVCTHNEPYTNHNYHSWNAFVMLTETGQ